MRWFCYVCSLPVTWHEDGGHTIRSTEVQNPMIHAKLISLPVVYEPELTAIEGIGFFYIFGSCDFDLDPMTFIYEHNPYCVEIHRMCKYELLMWRLLKVIVWQIERCTESTEIIEYVVSRVLKNVKSAGKHWVLLVHMATVWYSRAIVPVYRIKISPAAAVRFSPS